MTTFPYGYARPPGGGPQGMGTMLTWDQMMTKSTVRNLHPEVRRRFRALIEAAAKVGVALGPGTGWRVQPNPPPPGFAKPGNSWHESTPVSPTSATAMAIDTVPNVSWDWMERHCGSFGLRTFRNVNNEPWHIQPIEISAARKYATVCPHLKLWDLPGNLTPPKPIPGGKDDMKPLSPIIRNSDTRVYGGNGLTANTVYSFGLNPDIFPANTNIVAMNVAVIGSKGPGYLTVWPNGTTVPNTSVVNYEGNKQPRNGSVIIGVDKLNFQLRVTSQAHVVFDVTAFGTASSVTQPPS